MGSSFGSLYLSDVEQVLLAVSSRDPAHAHDEGLDDAVQRVKHAIALATLDAGGVEWRDGTGDGDDEVVVRLTPDSVRSAAQTTLAAPLPPSRVWDLSQRLDAVLTDAWRVAVDAAADAAQAAVDGGGDAPVAALWPRPYDAARDMVRAAARCACERALAILARQPPEPQGRVEVHAVHGRFKAWHGCLASLALHRAEMRTVFVLRSTDTAGAISVRDAAARVKALELDWTPDAEALAGVRVVPWPSASAAELAWSAEDASAPWVRLGAAMRPALREAYDARGWTCGWTDARRIAAAVLAPAAGEA
jgi:hypothetical protein